MEGNYVKQFMCRACLQWSQEGFSFFEKIPEVDSTIASMLEECSIAIEINDEFPQTFCYPCLLDLYKSVNFLRKFRQSQKELTDKFGDMQMAEQEATSNSTSKDIQNSESNDENCESFIIKLDSGEDSDDELALVKKSIELTKQQRENLSDEGSGDNISDFEEIPEEIDNNHKQTVEINSDGNQSTSADKPVLEKDTLSCPLCRKTFKQFRFFICHVKNHQKPLTCNSCRMYFTDADAFIKHYHKEHRFIPDLGARQYAKPASQPKSVMNGYVCAHENCSRSFVAKVSLINHIMAKHSDKKNCLCKLCGASFKNYDQLNYHLKKHKGPSHLCNVCGKKFMQVVHLRDHMWRHQGVKPHMCAYCGKGFVNRTLMNAHVEKKHRDEL